MATRKDQDRWSPGSPFIHELKGNNPRAWHSWVEVLTQAARRVRVDDREFPPLLGGQEGMLAINAVYGMLIGYAVECALKGLWVQAGNPIVAGGEYLGVPEAGDHDLGKLARVVCNTTGIHVTRAELSILDRLSAFIVFAGRYPIPRKPRAMKPIRVPGGKKQVPHVFLRADFEIAERVLNRLTRALNPFLPPLERKATSRKPRPAGS